jgi:ADP-L-glycero-D-manno-heptose 6-epimerase
MIVVTGAAGFIGSVLVESLNQAGHTDLLLVDSLGSQDKFKNLRAKQFTTLLSPEQFLSQLHSGAITPETILHIGAITDTGEKDADLMYRMNTEYTRSLAAWSLEHGARFIYASSASVYGNGDFGFDDDDSLTPKLIPMNPYAYSKWLFDSMAVAEKWSDKIVGLRFFNVFGPNEYHKARMASVVWHAFNQIKSTGQIELFQSHKEGYGDGGQTRDFIYVKDVCSVILWFLDHKDANGIFNLGTGNARTFNDLAGAIFGALSLAPNIKFVPTPEQYRKSYQYFTEADLTKLRAAGCDYKFADLEDSVADYIKRYLQQDNPYQ